MISHPTLHGKYEFIIELLYGASQRQRRTPCMSRKEGVALIYFVSIVIILCIFLYINME